MGIHALVRIFDQLVNGHVFRQRLNPIAKAELERLFKRLVEVHQFPLHLSHKASSLHIVCTWDNQKKLVSPHSNEEVLACLVTIDKGNQGYYQLVSIQVTVLVVDLFQAVQVDKDYRSGLSCFLHLVQNHGKGIITRSTVENTCHFVRCCMLFHFHVHGLNLREHGVNTIGQLTNFVSPLYSYPVLGLLGHGDLVHLTVKRLHPVYNGLFNGKHNDHQKNFQRNQNHKDGFYFLFLSQLINVTGQAQGQAVVLIGVDQRQTNGRSRLVFKLPVDC